MGFIFSRRTSTNPPAYSQSSSALVPVPGPKGDRGDVGPEGPAGPSGGTDADLAVAALGQGRTVTTLNQYFKNNARFNVADYGADLSGATDSTAAVQATVDNMLAGTSLGVVANTRNSLGTLYFPHGKTRIDGTLTIKSALGLDIEGDGYQSEIASYGGTAGSPKLCAIDLDGVAFSTIRNVRVTLDAASEHTYGVLYRWTSNSPTRSSTRLVLDNALVGGKWRTAGWQFGEPGTAVQADQVWTINGSGAIGSWTQGEDTYWQWGIRCGTGVSGNAVIFNLLAPTAIGCKYGIGVWFTGAIIDGGIIQSNGSDIYIQTAVGYFSLRGSRGEGSQRWVEHGGVSSVVCEATISQGDWNVPADDAQFAADGQFIRWYQPGTLNILGGRVHNALPTTQKPCIVASAGGVYPLTVNVDGLAIGGTDLNEAIIFGDHVQVNVRGYSMMNTDGSVAKQYNNIVLGRNVAGEYKVLGFASGAQIPQVWLGANPEDQGQLVATGKLKSTDTLSSDVGVEAPAASFATRVDTGIVAASENSAFAKQVNVGQNLIVGDTVVTQNAIVNVNQTTVGAHSAATQVSTGETQVGTRLVQNRVDLGAAGSAFTINSTLGNYFRLQLTADLNLTIDTTAIAVGLYLVELEQDATGDHALTALNNAVDWMGGGLPLLDRTPSATTALRLFWNGAKFIDVGRGSATGYPGDFVASGILTGLVPTRVVLDNDTASTADRVLLINCAGGNYTETLYAAAPRTALAIHRTDDGTSGHTCTIQPAGTDTINGAPGPITMQAGERVELIGVAGGWYMTRSRPDFAAAPTTAISALSSATTLSGGPKLAKCDATTAAFTVTLPTAVGAGGVTYTVKKSDSSANAITVSTTGSETIDGAASYILGAQYDSLSVMSDGANWVIV